MREQIIKVPMKIDAKTWSTNQIYAGKHWSVRYRLKEDMLLRTNGFKRIEKFTAPCEIECVFFNSSIRDVDNHSFLLKVIIDCLVAHGVLADDTSKHIRKVSLAKAKDESYSGVVVRISEWSDSKDFECKWLKVLPSEYR